MDNEKKEILPKTQDKSFWCVVANIKEEIQFGTDGKEIKSGLKKFKAGAKVYIVYTGFGMNEHIVVIGQYRCSNKYISCIIKISAIENLRIKKVYSKRIIKMVENYNYIEILTKEKAEKIYRILPSWINYK